MPRKFAAIWSVLLVTAVLLSACSPSTGSVVSSSAGNGDESSETTQSTTADKTSVHSTATTATKPTAVYPLRKPWESVSDETKRMLEDCGISYEDIIVDKSRLNYDKNWSSTDIHPKYSTYSLDDRRYSFNDLNGKLTFVSLPKDFDFVEEKTEEEIRRIAETFADLFIDMTEYTCTYRYYDETYRCYDFDFAKIVNGYQTFSGIGVSLFANGKIGSFSICKIGLFDDVTAPTIDESTIKSKCEEILRERYDNLDRFEMKDLSEAKLDIKDGQLLAYYQKQPEIDYGQWVMICNCKPYFTDGQYGRWEYVLVPLVE